MGDLDPYQKPNFWGWVFIATVFVLMASCIATAIFYSPPERHVDNCCECQCIEMCVDKE